MKIYLCCGNKTGVARPDGWTGFDIRPPADVLQDVRTLDGNRFRNATLIFATPPCDGFTDLPWRPATEEHLDVLFACLRVCRESMAPWILENSRFAQKYIGPSDFHRGPHHFWANWSGLVPLFNHVKGRTSGKYPLKRAALPVIL